MTTKAHSLCGVLALCLAAASPASAQVKLLEPVNAGHVVNTKDDETDPFLLPDGLRLMFASNTSGTFDLAVGGRKAANQPFDTLTQMAPLNTKTADERAPFFDVTRKELFYASNRVPEGAPKDIKNFDVYAKAGPAAAFPLPALNTPVEELAPWITLGGSEFYFSRKAKDGWRVCFTNGPKVGAPDKGRTVEEIPANFHHATLSPDALTMYLQGPLGNDRTGLFKTTRKKAGDPWEKPKALVNLNHTDAKQGDMAPALSLDGKMLFFASDRPGGQGGLDIWWVPVAELKTE